jgi:hypothetical protein
MTEDHARDTRWLFDILQSSPGWMWIECDSIS